MQGEADLSTSLRDDKSKGSCEMTDLQVMGNPTKVISPLLLFIIHVLVD